MVFSISSRSPQCCALFNEMTDILDGYIIRCASHSIVIFRMLLPVHQTFRLSKYNGAIAEFYAKWNTLFEFFDTVA